MCLQYKFGPECSKRKHPYSWTNQATFGWAIAIQHVVPFHDWERSQQSLAQAAQLEAPPRIVLEPHGEKQTRLQVEATPEVLEPGVNRDFHFFNPKAIYRRCFWPWATSGLALLAMLKSSGFAAPVCSYLKGPTL